MTPNDGRVHCYWTRSSSQTWSEAQQSCMMQDGHLVTILSAEENAFVVSIAQFSSSFSDTWIGATGTFAGATPTVDELGVTHWVNAYRAGDYVGRALWTPQDDPQSFAVAATAPDGAVAARRAAGRTEFCLGAGAHTHYFSNDAVALAAEIDRLVGASG